jgi:hypothetical protein
MTCKPLDLPSAVARAFVKDMGPTSPKTIDASGKRMHCDSFTSSENTKDGARKRFAFPM